MLSIERGLGANTVLSLNYVGTQGHRLLVLEESNPGDPALCLFLSNPANLAPGQVPCGPFGEDSHLHDRHRGRSSRARAALWGRISAAMPTKPPSEIPTTTPCRSPCGIPAGV